MSDLTIPGDLTAIRIGAPDPGLRVEAEIRAARRSRAFGWIGLLAVMAPWGIGALVVLACLRVG